MNINMNVRAEGREAMPDVQKQKQADRKTLYAGDTKSFSGESVLEKRIKAQKDAMKVLLDQHRSETDLDDSLDKLETRRDELAAEAKAAQDELKKVAELRKAYQEDRGVTADTPVEELPQDEDYQKAMEQFDSMEEYWQGEAESKLDMRKMIGQTLSDIKIERAKTHPMVDAASQAEEIMEDATKEIIGMLQQEAVEHVDEEYAENVEEAEKKAEKEEEAEEKLEAAREKRREQEELADEIRESTQDTGRVVPHSLLKVTGEADKLQQKVESLMKAEGMLTEDIKGIEVDARL